MSLLGRFFGKKKDDLGLGDMGPGMGPDLGSNMGPGMGPDMGGGMPNFGDPMGSPDQGFGMPGQMPGMPPPDQSQGGFSPESVGFERVPSGAPSSYSSHPQTLDSINMGKDLEIISAKLDAIKAELDSMSQRLKRLERIAEGETPQYKDKWNY